MIMMMIIIIDKTLLNKLVCFNITIYFVKIIIYMSVYSNTYSDNETINTKWIDEFDNYKQFYKDKINSITLFIYYTNKNNEIFNIHKENTNLNNKSILTQEKLVYLLKHFSLKNNKQYKLEYILKYNPYYNNDDIINEIKNNSISLDNIGNQEEKYIDEIKSLNDIVWYDCIDIFRDLNELHIFYKEKNIEKEKCKSHNNTIKRVKFNILKKRGKTRKI